MSDFIKSNIEARANLVAQMREVIDAADAAKRGLSGEELQTIERLESEIESRDASINTAQKVAEREARAMEAAASFQPAAETTRSNDSEVLRSIARGDMRGHEFMNEERSALVPSTNTVGQSFYAQVFQIAQLVGPMLQTSEVFNTATGENLVIPTVTALSSSTATAAGAIITESNPTFSSITLGADKFASLVNISNELLTDAGFDISSYIAQQLGTSLGIAINAQLTTGTAGLATRATATVRGTATDFLPTYNEILDLVYSIADGARVLPGNGFQASKTGIAALRKMKDGDGSYIWKDSISATQAQPATLLGYPVYENPAVAATGTAAVSVLFGNLPSYKVRVAGGIQVAQSSDYSFANDITAFRGVVRIGGDLTHATHVAAFKGK